MRHTAIRLTFRRRSTFNFYEYRERRLSLLPYNFGEHSKRLTVPKHKNWKDAKICQTEDSVNMVGANGNNGSNGSNGQNGDHAARVGTIRVKQGLAQMLKGGVIVSTWRFNRIRCLLDANPELQSLSRKSRK